MTAEEKREDTAGPRERDGGGDGERQRQAKFPYKERKRKKEKSKKVSKYSSRKPYTATNDDETRSQKFPALSALTFPIPPAQPRSHEYTTYGRDPASVESSDESSSGSSDHEDKSGEYGSDRSSPSHHGAATAPISGPHRFKGNWPGNLANSAGYSIQIRELLSEGNHGSVYDGELLQRGLTASPIAIKVSDTKDFLLREFSNYQRLKNLIGESIPVCHGVCFASGTAFLVLDRLHNRPIRDLSKAERGAVYAALRKMHNSGWIHNDFLDPVSNGIRNLLWNHAGRPVLIDLVTATSHCCHTRYDELRRLRTTLQISKRDISIWARERSVISRHGQGRGLVPDRCPGMSE
ncbi:hypothetical protein DFH09DRAFT_1088042 [Mycena vulgaris]|nr:hypothetical protein DFH09DRAFT_1088042 [Mycena vulgaris]